MADDYVQRKFLTAYSDFTSPHAARTLSSHKRKMNHSKMKKRKTQPLASKEAALASSSLQLSHNLAAHFEQAPLYLPQKRPVGAVTFQNAELRQRGKRQQLLQSLPGPSARRSQPRDRAPVWPPVGGSPHCSGAHAHTYCRQLITG